jgi:hypothetical protein
MAHIEEPKSLLEVREWKRKVSERMEAMGLDAYCKDSSERHMGFKEELEKRRLAKKAKAA